jgi:ketose-bisphosphate aldolase
MSFLPMIELLRDAEKRGYAVPSFCCWGPQSMKTVLEAAQEMRAPVIMMNGWAEHIPVGPPLHGPIARAVMERYDVVSSLHLDHGRSIEEVRQGLEGRYNSVMLDYSMRSFAQNIAGMKTVVGMAKPLGVTVEGELGAIGRADDTTEEGSAEKSLTDPDMAAEYVERTGIDALAVSIGNAHGLYRALPRLDFDRLRRIRGRVGVPLVLHGGSGTPEEDLVRAIELGIAKINVASELVHTVRRTLTEQWEAEKNLWLPLAEVEAYRNMAEVVRTWLRKTGAEGKA